MFRSHVAFSLIIGLLTFKFFNLNPYIYISLIMFFGIFIDLDSSKSYIGKKLGILSQIINFIFGHRKIFHSIWFTLALSIGAYFLINGYFIAVLIGSLSHLILDSLTREGIMPFYPIKYKINGVFKTNGFFELIFFICLIIINFVLLFNIIF